MKRRNMVKGMEYIRIAPTSGKIKDYSYTNSFMVFDGYDANGNYIMHYPKESFHGRCLGTTPKTMSMDFSDSNWRPATNPYDGVKTKLHQWKGKLVKRVRPVRNEDGSVMSANFMDEGVELESATRYHVVCRNPKDGYVYLLNILYANPDDWMLA